MDISANLPTQGTGLARGLIGACAQTIPRIPGMCAAIVSKQCKGCADTLKCTAKGKALVQKTRLGGFELEPPPPVVDDTVKDNMDIDSGYALDYGSNSRWQQPRCMTLLRITNAHGCAAPSLGISATSTPTRHLWGSSGNPAQLCSGTRCHQQPSTINAPMRHHWGSLGGPAHMCSGNCCHQHVLATSAPTRQTQPFNQRCELQTPS